MDNFEETLRMASNGDMIAQYEIGAFYERQGNYDNAMYWLKQSAEQEYDLAQYMIALNYEKGLGSSKDYEKAAYYFLLSAKQGFKSSMFELSTMYELGLGVPRDYQKANFWRDKYYEPE